MKTYQVIVSCGSEHHTVYNNSINSDNAIIKAKTKLFHYDGPLKGKSPDECEYATDVVLCCRCRDISGEFWLTYTAPKPNPIPCCAGCLPKMLDKSLPQTVTAIVPTGY